MIADFGIARFEEGELLTAVETKDSEKLANFQYAAPEQRRRGAPADCRADIYALGLILHEMFTGRVPYGQRYRTISQDASDFAYIDDLVVQMLCDSPDDRPPSIEAVKLQLIGRQKEFVMRQRLSDLKKAVVPATKPDDPLITDPPRLIDRDWTRGTLTLVLSRPVNALWIGVMKNMSGIRWPENKHPSQFTFSGKEAAIRAREDEVQFIIDHFKEWLPTANQIYAHQVRRNAEEKEIALRQEQERRIKEAEARQRVLRNTKV